jgi:hypothetical protein
VLAEHVPIGQRRRYPEAYRSLRASRFEGWLPPHRPAKHQLEDTSSPERPSAAPASVAAAALRPRVRFARPAKHEGFSGGGDEAATTLPSSFSTARSAPTASSASSHVRGREGRFPPPEHPRIIGEEGRPDELDVSSVKQDATQPPILPTRRSPASGSAVRTGHLCARSYVNLTGRAGRCASDFVRLARLSQEAACWAASVVQPSAGVAASLTIKLSRPGPRFRGARAQLAPTVTWTNTRRPPQKTPTRG